MNLDLAQEGVQAQWLDTAKKRLQDMVLPIAEKYFAEGGTPFTQNHPQLKKSEMVSRFFDYQPCCMSVLGALAAQGEERALIIIRRIFDNARYCLDEWREREGYRVTFRRSQFHMSLCYAQIKDLVDPSEAQAWHELLIRTGEDVFAHFNQFKEKSPKLDNRGFGTGINHIALSAEGMYKSGEILGRSDWQEAAAGFFDRLLVYGHPDGYFEEHTNDAREGGPSLLYTPLTAGSAYLTQRWRNAVDVNLFSKYGAFYRKLCNTQLCPLLFADERANPHHVGPYGLALHSITPEGRGFLRLVLDKINMIDHVGGDIYMQHLSRAYVELDNMETGAGTLPEPFPEGHHRLTLPLGVVRKNEWTAGLSALKALNREIAAKSDYALDRQSLICLSHAKAGIILEGAKAKHNPDWSTVRLGDDAYPTQTGELTTQANGANARVIYNTFDIQITWTLSEIAQLKMNSDIDQELLAQLPLEINLGDSLILNGEKTITLNEQEQSFDQVKTVATDHWIVEANQAGTLKWPIAPFNPYSEGNTSLTSTWRPLFIVPWKNEITFTFHTK